MQNWAFLCHSSDKAANKCTKKRDAYKKLLFCLLNLGIIFLTFSLPLCHWIAKVLNVLRVGILIESHLKWVLKKTFINNIE